MKQSATILAMLSLAPLTLALAQPQTAASAQAKLNVKRDIPYAEPADSRQKVDIYAPEGAKNLPVVFWIHGGGWVNGPKSGRQGKPQGLSGKGLVFAATGYRPPTSMALGQILSRCLHDAPAC